MAKQYPLAGYILLLSLVLWLTVGILHGILSSILFESFNIKYYSPAQNVSHNEYVKKEADKHRGVSVELKMDGITNIDKDAISGTHYYATVDYNKSPFLVSWSSKGADYCHVSAYEAIQVKEFGTLDFKGKRVSTSGSFHIFLDPLQHPAYSLETRCENNDKRFNKADVRIEPVGGVYGP